MEINANTSIEDIVEAGVPLINYLSEKGIRCIVCGEPIWGTLEEAAIEKGYTRDQIEKVVVELNALLRGLG
jgi:hypothetical protein